MARVWGLSALTWLLLLTPPVLAAAAFGGLLFAVWPRLGLIHVFLGLVVGGLWIHFLGAVNVARAGLTVADLRRVRLSLATGTSGVFDTTDRVDAWARMFDSGPVSDASRELPELQTLVEQTAAGLALPVPTVKLARTGAAVVVLEQGREVLVGTGFLLVGSVDELRAELVRQLAPFAMARPAVRALDAARAAVTAGAWRVPGVTSRLDFLWWPASEAAGMAERTATDLASEVRAGAAWHAEHVAGRAVERIASERTLVLSEIWRQHLREHQQRWTVAGDAMAPHEGWREAWEQRRAAGRPVVIDAVDVVDVPALSGWLAPVPDSAIAPPAAQHSALEQLTAGDVEPVLASFDQMAASQYYEPVMNETLGAAGGPMPLDGVDEHGGWSAPPVLAPSTPALRPADPSHGPVEVLVRSDVVGTGTAPSLQFDLRNAPLAIDERAAMPHVDLIVRQLDALDEGMHRRDAHALATARAISGVAEAPTVKTMAAGVRWLCGDPEGVHAIRTALLDAPRGAGSLADLVPALRAAGDQETAALVQSAVAQVEQVILARFNLRKMWGRAPKLLEPQLPPSVKAALDEIARLYPNRVRLYLADVGVEAPTGSLRPSVFVVVKSFWTLKLRGPDGDPAGLVRLVWPTTQLLDTSEIEGRGRKHLRKHVTRLG